MDWKTGNPEAGNPEKYFARTVVRRRVSLIVLLIDNLTEKVIRDGDVSVRVGGEKPPVKKPEGYYVFVDLSAPEGTLKIESARYEPMTVPFRLAKEPPLFFLRLIPGRAYPAGRGLFIEGKAGPGDVLSLIWKNKSRSIRLLEDYCAGEENSEMIRLDLPEKEALAGKLLCMEQGGGRELFTIWEPGERSQQLLRPLSGDYKKTLALAYPAYRVTAGESGSFHIFVPGRGQEIQEYLCVRNDSFHRPKVCHFFGGAGNRLNFKEEE